MKDAERRRSWDTERIEAYVWYCGDDCQCTQPLIQRILPNREAGYPWIRRENVWEGTFHTQATAEEYEQQEAELAQACAERGIPLESK